MKRRDVCGILVLLVYLMGVGLVTGPSLYQLLAGRLPEPKLELIPFADIVTVLQDTDTPGLGAFTNIVGNLALLAPLGFLLPLFWSCFSKARHTILFSAGLSLSIELIQLIAGGVTSVDDLILNTAAQRSAMRWQSCFCAPARDLHRDATAAQHGAIRSHVGWWLSCW